MYLPDARPGTVYGYRVHGPYEPDAGHRFNPNKLLIDPYARQLLGGFQWHPALFGYQVESRDDRTFDDRDSAPFTLKSCVIDPAFTWGRAPHIDVAWENTIIYEAHVRGFTSLHPAVAPELRGTYAGLASRRSPSTYPRSASPRSSCCRSTPSSTTATSSTMGCATTGATTASASSRPTRRYAANVASPSPSSRRWWPASIRPGSRSSSTSSTTIPRRATSSGPRSASRASTTPPTTGSARRAALLHQRHRHRQHGQSQPFARAADGDGQPALLGQRDAGRRIPLRSRHHPRPRAPRLRRGGRLPRRLPPGPGRCRRSS